MRDRIQNSLARLVAPAVGLALVIAALVSLAGASAAADGDDVRLRIRYADGEGHVKIWHLECTDSGRRATGHLHRVGSWRACRAARRKADFLASTPDPMRICTEIYGGPQRARITGQIGARMINRRFTRENGCNIADWERARPLLPRTRGAFFPRGL